MNDDTTTTPGTATFVRSLTDWSSDARLYRVEPPARYTCNFTGGYDHTSHVIVSAVRTAFDTGRPETMVFPADSHGVPINMSDMFVTYTYDHTAALAGLDYWPTPDTASRVTEDDSRCPYIWHGLPAPDPADRVTLEDRWSYGRDGLPYDPAHPTASHIR